MITILVFILGIFAVFVFSFNAFQTAKVTERNHFLWTIIVFAIGLGIQILLPVFSFIFLAIIVLLGLINQETIETSVFLELIIVIIAIIISCGVMLRILNYLGKIPESDEIYSSPPPPTDYDLDLK